LLIRCRSAGSSGAGPPLANAADIAIPRCVENADEAIAIVREWHAAWLRQN